MRLAERCLQHEHVAECKRAGWWLQAALESQGKNKGKKEKKPAMKREAAGEKWCAAAPPCLPPCACCLALWHVESSGSDHSEAGHACSGCLGHIM